MWSLGSRGANSETDRNRSVFCLDRRVDIRLSLQKELRRMRRIGIRIALSGQKTRKARKVLMVLLAILLTVAGLLNAMTVCPVYAAADTGWKDPSANAADAGDGFEVSPGNAHSDDDAIAGNVDGADDSHRYYGYDFGLPGGAAIKGIEVRLDWYLDSKQGNSSIDVELSWDGGTSWTDAKTTGKGDTTETTDILGDPSDTWGRDWALGELSSDNFRVRVTCTSNKSERDFYLDWVSLNVYYTVDTGWTNPSDNGADTGGDGDGFEGSPGNAYSDDDAVASNVDGAGDSHLYYTYGFELPEGATIEGIEVRLDWYLDSTQGNSKLEVQLSWDGGTSWTDAQTTKNGSTSETTDILGGPTDTWGRSWTVDELSDANFRLRVTCTSNKPERDFYLDWVPVNVYDDPPTAVDLTFFSAHSGAGAAAGRGAWHFWPWVGLMVLAALGVGGVVWARRRVG
jgi:hypothetical protein